MNYFEFDKLSIGSIRELHSVDFGNMRFVKISDYRWLVEFDFFVPGDGLFTRFTTSVSCITAAKLYEVYEKKC